MWYTEHNYQVLALALTIVWITASGQWRAVRAVIRQPHYSTILQAVLDNAAWISFAFATTFISIGIATAISEGYIALAALLGIFLGREKLRGHQLAGVIVALTAILILAASAA